MRIKNLLLLGLFFVWIFVGIFKAQTPSDFYITDDQGSNNPILNCGYPFVNNFCVKLNAHYPQFKLTDTYSVNSIPFSPYTATNKTVIKQNLDDEFTGIIPLPFTFCFYGVAYDKLVIGSNGMISFDINQANQPNAPNFTDTLPNQKLPKQSIFGVLHDMVFSTSDDSEISYSVVGAAPFRKFIVDFHKGRLSNCNSQTSTSQIVLSEGSNIIEIFVENKEIPCSLQSFRNSLIGINDAAGNAGLAAPGRNTGIWSATNEAWVFKPAGNDLVPTFSWYDSSGTLLGTDGSLKVCPQKDETYKVDIVFSTCNGESKTYTDDIDVKFAIDYPTVQNYTKLVCNVTDQIVLANYKQFLTTNNISNFDFEFRDSVTGILVDENTPFTINADRSFDVTIISKKSPDCKKTTTLKLQFFSDNILTNILNVCDEKNDGVENAYNLSKLDEQLVGKNYQGSVGYFKNYNDAFNNINSIITDNLVDGKQYYIRLSYQNCANVFGPVTIHFNPTPIVVTAQPVVIKVDICSAVPTGSTDYNFDTLVRPKITSDPGVSLIRVFNTRNEAENALPSDTGLTAITGGNYTIYARVEYPGGCFSIVEIFLQVTFGVIKLSNPDQYICFDGTQDIPVDLDDITNGLLISPLDGTVTGPRFFATPEDADNNTPVLSSNQFLITDDGDLITKTYYVRYDRGVDCYTVLPININLIHLVKNIDQFNICDFRNDNSESINLADYSSSINIQPGTQIQYFSTSQAATDNLPGTEITTANVTSTSNLVVYARVSLHKCVVIFPITYTLYRAPEMKPSFNALVKNICDNNANNVENIKIRQYESDLNINNLTNIEFNYYQSYDAATNTFSNQFTDYDNVPISKGTVVYVKVNYLNSGCFSKSEIIFDTQFYPSIILSKNAVKKLCDADSNFGESFNLEEQSITDQIFNQNANTDLLKDITITYYYTEADANNGTAFGLIPNPKTFITYSANEYVYARFQSKIDGCYSVAPIDLLSVFPTKANNSIINICDNNLDGYYDVNLLDFENQMVQTPNPDNVFKFYINKTDIGVPSKEIKTPENFILNPYVNKIWVRVENLTNCGTIAEVIFNNGTQVALSQNKFNIDKCDTGDDGKEIIDLSQFESTIGAYSFEYYESLQNMNNNVGKLTNFANYPFDESKGISKFYVKVIDAGNCPNFYTIDVKLYKTPIITIGDYEYCKNNLSGIDIKPNFTGLNVIYYKWEFPDGTIVEGPNKNSLIGVKLIGTYKLTLTNVANCSATNTFNVLNVETPEIVSLTGENDSYTVIATGTAGRKIVYSMDLINWQDSNRFDHLLPGDYYFYVKYADSTCYGDVRKGKIFSIINALTPNGDGVNDYWKLEGLDVFPEKSNLEIFDKYGNLVYSQASNTEFIWDGKVNGRNLPTDAYWYVIKAADGRLYKGWILLKNRN